MSVYVNRNIKGHWERVVVSDEEIAEITKKNFVSNMNIAIGCLIDVRNALSKSKRIAESGVAPSTDTADRIAVAIIEKMTKPLHYDIENYVDENLAKKNLL